MLTLAWIAGSVVSLSMLALVFVLVNDQNRRHMAFRAASPLRVWRGRRRGPRRESWTVRSTQLPTLDDPVTVGQGELPG
jgi:hypothetical protein